MPERPTTADLAAWRVADLPDGFADRVLARMDATTVLDDECERIAAVRPLPRPRHSGALAIACAVAAALVLLWILRPDPPAAVRSALRSVVVADPILPASRGLEPAAIRRAIEEQLVPGVTLCYDALVVSELDARGQVIIELDVVRRGERGVVARAAFDPRSELDFPIFRDCALKYARMVVFDPPAGPDPVEVVLPLELRAGWHWQHDE